MKQQDIVTLLVVIFVGGMSAFMVTKFFVNTPENRSEEVEVVSAIDAEFKQPDKRYFNENAFNPTQLITISEDNNTNPFGN